MGGSQEEGYPFRGPHNKNYSILGSILGSPKFGKLPYGSYTAVVSGLFWVSI